MYIPFHDIKREVWNNTHTKWVQCLINDEDDWQCCSVCYVVRHEFLCEDCSLHCPLSVSEWCKADKEESRLSTFYIQEGMHKHQTHAEWHQNVEDYLNWLDIEIEDMQHAEDLKIFGTLAETA